jgi:hypothetical protein
VPLPAPVPPPEAGLASDAAPEPLAGLAPPFVVDAGVELLPPLQPASATADANSNAQKCPQKRPGQSKRLMSIPLPTGKSVHPDYRPLRRNWPDMAGFGRFFGGFHGKRGGLLRVPIRRAPSRLTK